MRTQPRTFTSYNSVISKVLKNEVGISSSIPSISASNSTSKRDCSAIWDTGATHTIIVPKIVTECKLIESGKIDVIGVNGQRERTSTYLVDIWLPNRVCLPGIDVAVMSLSGNEDMLIGMDIINLGDFVVSNYNGKTIFSFRMPSLESIDFLPKKDRLNPHTIINESPKIGRNSTCPCGSGKKYKRCCGT